MNINAAVLIEVHVCMYACTHNTQQKLGVVFNLGVVISQFHKMM